MTNPCTRCEKLQEQVWALEAALEVNDTFKKLPNLEPSASSLIRLIASKRRVSKAQIAAMLWGGDASGGPINPGGNLSVHLFRARRWLAPHAIAIKAVWGEGLEVSIDDLPRLRDLIADYDAGGR